METVHHILVTIEPPGGGRSGGGRLNGGNLIAVYAPGQNPGADLIIGWPTAIHVKAGSKLLFEMHYTPNGTAQKDRSFVGFKFADPSKNQEGSRRAECGQLHTFKIPPGDPRIRGRVGGVVFRQKALLLTISATHARGAGKTSRPMTLIYPGWKARNHFVGVPGATTSAGRRLTSSPNPKCCPKARRCIAVSHFRQLARTIRRTPIRRKTVGVGRARPCEEMTRNRPRSRVPASTQATIYRLRANHDGSAS